MLAFPNASMLSKFCGEIYAFLLDLQAFAIQRPFFEGQTVTMYSMGSFILMWKTYNITWGTSQFLNAETMNTNHVQCWNYFWILHNTAPPPPAKYLEVRFC